MDDDQFTVMQERVVPDVHDGHYYRHLKHYQFAERFTKSARKVLDIGCGNGYGSALLADGAGHVVAVDYSPQAIAYSDEHFGRSNLAFKVMDSRQLQFEANTFDVVVSLQVFEHVLEWRQMLDEVRRVLRPGGIFVMSTPNRMTTQLQERISGQPHYVFHVNEVNAKELAVRLREFFPVVDLFALRRRGSAVYAFLRRLDAWNMRLRVPLWMRHKLSEVVGVRWDGDAIQSPEDFVVESRGLRSALSLIAVSQTSTVSAP